MKKKILVLGCGKDKYTLFNKRTYSKSFEVIGLDKIKLPTVDVIHDLEKTPLPFKDNFFDEVHANHILEHIANFVPLMHEIWRITKSKGIVKIKVPFYSSWIQFSHPTHVRFFTPFSFDFFCMGTYEVTPNRKMFNLKKRRINFGGTVGFSRKLNWLMNPIINWNHKLYCRLFAWVIPSTEISFELEVVKS